MEECQQFTQAVVGYASPADMKVECVSGALELGDAGDPLDPLKERCLVSLRPVAHAFANENRHTTGDYHAGLSAGALRA
jgi:hypothetical protein